MSNTRQTKSVAIVGASGFGREVLWLIREINHASPEAEWTITGFLDDNPALQGKRICDADVLGPASWLLEHPEVYAVCGIADTRIRRQVTRALEKGGVTFASFVHPSVRQSQYVTIGQGTVVCAGSTITTQVTIGSHVHVNLHVTVGHDVVIEDFVTVAPGVNISGNVHLRRGCELGTNSSIIQGLSIGEGTIVGAGGVVTRDLDSNCVAVGMPARAIKTIDSFGD